MTFNLCDRFREAGHTVVRSSSRAVSAFSVLLLACGVAEQPDALAAGSTARSSHALSYQHDTIPSGPWSIHIVRVERSNPDFELQTTLAGGSTFGLSTLSDQIKALPPGIGRAVAGVNGDFFRKKQPCTGDPKGLQIVRGELVSAPCDWSCFWTDAEGQPHMTNVLVRFYVLWPDGRKTAFGLNEPRPRDGAVLYTSVVGDGTGTSGGRELILERNGTNSWLPLRAGVTYSARVREVREGGDSRLTGDAMVLSLGPNVTTRVPNVPRGTVLQLSTDTWPDLAGAQMGIGGGPALVRNARVLEQESTRVRHPRTAVGWNKDYYFLVEVDGRQRNLSVGMTLAELAEYMAKLGCDEALNLDGGASATCWVYGLVMNSPSSGAERLMGNGLIVLQKESK